jgi:FtsP/CotA-like multicopper oxidase with cupredoxin domain
MGKPQASPTWEYPMNAVRQHQALAGAVILLLGGTFLPDAAAAAPESRLAAIEPNDNLRAAGRLEGGTLMLALRAGIGRWQPEGPSGPTLEIEAFGEIGKALTVPAPLVRVREGTEIAVSIRNDRGTALIVRGFCTRGGAACPPLEVAPDQTREVRFTTGPAGTYHYWASTLGAPVPFRELAGALVVDPPTGPIEPDRIMVITEWTTLTNQQLMEIVSADEPTEAFVRLDPRVTFVINGLSWPATERFAYELGQRVRWRVINLSSQAHPMHLHGFYFEVNSLGDGWRDSPLAAGEPRRVVTQLLPPSGTMTLTWIPERAGNWLFHCHIMHHVSVDRRLERDEVPAHHEGAHASHGSAGDISLGMAGMVIGVTVRDPAPDAVPVASSAVPRKLTLVMQPARGDYGGVSPAGFVLSEGSASPVSDTATSPGPAIVLRRHEPVEITLVNRLTEATAIHWHGMELDSYYDGVHGWSGIGQRVTPMIEPGGSFAIRFIPPRAGTFIYHTHLHDYRQLSSGLYGPLIVTEADETFDLATDHAVVIARRGVASEERSVLTDPESVVINGERAPRFVWQAGTRHRVRLINITPDDIFSVVLQSSEGPVQWRPIAKDGEPLMPGKPVAAHARQTIAVGETYDFEYQAPAGRKTLWLEVRTRSGKWQAQGHVIVK